MPERNSPGSGKTTPSSRYRQCQSEIPPVAVRRHPPAATEGKLPASMPEDSMIDWDQKR